MDKLGVTIKDAREKKHLTQKQLTKRLSISTRHLISIENGRKKPSYNLLYLIIRELEIQPDTIFYPEYNYDMLVEKKLLMLLKECAEQDIKAIVGVLQSILDNKKMGGETNAALNNAPY
jgi:transcriptional regulator with XRE-family HTH domain